jgi:TPR repeat protein
VKEDPQALYELGYCYQNGLGAHHNSENITAGFWCFQKAANLGNADAQNALGECYRRGLGTTQDYKLCIHYYRKAASQGHPKALYMLGNFHMVALFGVRKDLKMAFNYFRQAAEKGDPEANCEIAYLYLNGGGVRTDPVAAVRHFQAAAEKGNCEAQRELGVCFSTGTGTIKNDQLALRWLSMAVQQGNPAAQYLLADWYRNGNIVSKDEVKAFQLDFLAAQSDYVYSMMNVGVCYIEGKGVQQDSQLGLKYLKLVVEADDPERSHDAEFMLGLCYSGFLGVDRDEKQSLRYERSQFSFFVFFSPKKPKNRVPGKVPSRLSSPDNR